jgi:long-chain fatty acid transport protein
MKRFAFLSTLALFAAPAVFAAGFGLYEGGSRGNALGGLTAQADDASAIFYNPAGITQLEGRHVMIGATLIRPEADLNITDNFYSGSTQSASYDSALYTPPHVYLTQQINDRLWVGAGFYSRFGLGSVYEDTSTFYGRYANTDTVIETVSLSGHVAYKVNDMVSVSFGVVFNYLTAELNQAIDANQLLLNPYNNPTTTSFDVHQRLEGDSSAWGYNFAIHVTPNDRWSLGMMYNSEVEHEVDGVAEFDKPAGLPPTFFVDTNVKTDPLDLPFMLFLGMSYDWSDKMTVGISAVQTGWSSIERLTFNYETPFVVIPGLGQQGVIDRAGRELLWEDSWRYAFGVDHEISDKMHFMWGFTYDETPVPDETISYLLPDSDRQLINLGVTYKMGAWQVEAAYNYLTAKKRDISGRLADGIYDTEVADLLAHLVAFTFTRKF